jgi:hypothetical protein
MSGGNNRELTPDTGRPLLHSLQTEVAIFALFCHRGVDANAIVSDEHRKIVSEFQFNFQSTTVDRFPLKVRWHAIVRRNELPIATILQPDIGEPVAVVVEFSVGLTSFVISPRHYRYVSMHANLEV